MFLGHGSNPFLTVEHEASARNLEASRKRMPTSTSFRNQMGATFDAEACHNPGEPPKDVSNLTVVRIQVWIGSQISPSLLSQGANEKACANVLCAAECLPSVSPNDSCFDP